MQKKENTSMKRHGVVIRPEGNLGATFNPGAARDAGGKFVMLVRSVPKGYQKIGDINQFDDNYTSHLSLWESDSPEKGFRLVNEAAIKPDQPFDQFGAEDPRITKIGDKYYIFYTSLAKGLAQPDADDGIRIAMASTKDFKTFEKHGVIGPDRRSKAGIVFESAGKNYFMWKDEAHQERTMLSPAPDDIEDAQAWKDFWTTRDIEKDQLLGPQDNGYEAHGIEPGAPPIETEDGLLLVYSSISDDFKWTISLMLLDKNDPTKILAKSEAPSLKPEADYEVTGDVNNVVFPCGALIDKGRLYVYYGGADTICAVGSESMANVRAALKPFRDNPVPRKPAP
ncbi:MAG: hypothetical protein GC185_05750 [Alphaproteobacteria bacterium]|nr:hypothetical protein [Alphaproteobacteria bacterium]